MESTRVRHPLRRVFAVISLTTLCTLTACAGSPSIFDTKGPVAANIADLTWLMFGIAAIVFVIVTALLLAAVVRGRRPLPTDEAFPHDRRAIQMIIIGGAVIPAVVLFIVMALSVITNPVNAAPDQNPLTIEVIGHQWWWEIRYPDQNVTTANEIHLPVNQLVNLRLTSADVIHSLWSPQLDGKMDVIPGQTNTLTLQASQVGTTLGECAEYCGLQHAHMDLMVVSEDSNQFNQWLVNQAKPAPDPDANAQPVLFKGQQTFLGSSCVYCHTIKGTNASGTLGPDLTHIGSRLTIGAGALSNNPGNLAGWIINSQTIKPGNLMPPMDLSSDQVQDIVTYLQSLQ